MRTLACLAVAVLAGGPAAATPIHIDDIATTALLPVEQLLTDAEWASALAGADRFVVAFDEPLIGVFEPGVADVIGSGGWHAYRSNVTSELLRAEDDDFAASQYALVPADDEGDRHAESAAPEDPESAREAPGASPANVQRDIERAAISHVQPAALTLAGVCLALAFAGGREWRRRNWHRRHMRRVR